MDIQWDDRAQAEIDTLVDNMLDTKLGPMMKEEVKRNTPVDLGHLRDSVDYSVEDHTLYVQAYGDDMREAENRKYYAAWVDLGHRLIAWGHDTGKIIKPTAFMRRALYRRYPGFLCLPCWGTIRTPSWLCARGF